jgi:transcriptional regulator with XRE-family HTH domain
MGTSTKKFDTLKNSFHKPAMITPAQCRGARGLLDWTQGRLATEAGVSLSTVKDFEGGHRTPIGNNLAAIRRALEAGGIEFIRENGGGPGARLRESAAAPAVPSGASKTAPPKKTRPRRS